MILRSRKLPKGCLRSLFVLFSNFSYFLLIVLFITFKYRVIISSCFMFSCVKASVEHNAWELKQYIEELYWGSGKRVMLLGHSKGGVDAAAALSMYWCDLEDKVAGLALVQSPYGGTPIASDILREGQVADKETRRIMELLICKLIKVVISFAKRLMPQAILVLVLLSCARVYG